MIVDTAGRTTVDEALMAEVRNIHAAIAPHYTFLVIDAMTGQDAVQTARAFHESLALDGVILTKIDGDARGGAALSVKTIVGRPIAFASTGERVADFETFHPDRMAGRILGMGDVLSLIERAESVYEEGASEAAMESLRSGKFTFDDFHEQLQQMKKMGPLSSVLGMMPGLPKEVKNATIEDRDVAHIEAIIRSMTAEERVNPSLIDGSRRLRIARGSGTSTTEINNLLRQFKEMQKMMRSSVLAAGLASAARRKKKKGGRVTPSSK